MYIAELTASELLMGVKAVETDIYHSRISSYLRKKIYKMLPVYNIIHVFGKHCSDFSRCSLLGRTVACVIGMNVKLLAVLMAPAAVLLLHLVWSESGSELLQSYPEF